MRILSSLAVAALMVFAMTTARAIPNLSATTGILAVPTAEVVDRGVVSGAVDVLFQNDTTVNGRVLVGLSPSVEVGAGLALDGDTILGITGKYRAPMPMGGFDWAFGATFAAADEGDEGFQVFAAGSRDFPLSGMDGVSLQGTLGVSFTDIDTASAFRPFLGAQLRMATGTEIASEFVFDSGDFDESIFSLLVRQDLSPRLVGEIGFTNAFGFTGAQDHDFFIGLAYAFNRANL